MKAREFTVPVNDFTPQTMHTQARTPRSFDPDEEISSFDPRYDESGQEAVHPRPMHTAMQSQTKTRTFDPSHDEEISAFDPQEAVHPRPTPRSTPFQACHPTAVQCSPSTVQQSKP